MNYYLIISCILLVLAKRSIAIMNRDLMSIDLNDILNEKMMPMSLIQFKSVGDSDSVAIDRKRDKQLFSTQTVADFNSAFNLMQFHRRMIQNYRCNNYLAKQILYDIAPHTLHNRLGLASNSTDVIQMPHRPPAMDNNVDSALFDQGSNAYKNWLTKVALLDDVYKQIRADNSAMKHVNETPPFRRIDGQSPSSDNEYEVGVASGYAIQHPIPSGFVPPQNHANDNDYEHFHRYAVAGNKAAAFVNNVNTLFEPSQISAHPIPQPPVYIPQTTYEFRPNPYPNFYAVSEPYLTPHVFYNENQTSDSSKSNKWWSFHNLKEKFKSLFKYKHKTYSNTQNLPAHQLSGYDSGYDYGMSYDSGGSSGKEMTLKKVYELALTAIAFLAFGIFVLQVIMCITTVKSQTGSMMMMVTEVSTEAVEMSEVRRNKRSNFDDSFSEVNEMSRRVLQSIEAAIVAHEDNGNCLKKVLCENNKMKKSSNNRIWLPVWGLGMSWLSSRLTNGQVDSPIMFDCLKAQIIGLGGGRCEENFKCNANVISNGRTQTRRLRETEN